MTTSEKIKEIYDRIENFIENQPKEQQEYLHYIFKDGCNSVRKKKELFTLFDYSRKEYTINEAESALKYAKRQAKKLENYSLAMCLNEEYKVVFVVYYDETETETLDRLTKNYNRMIEQAKKSEEDEFAKFLKLKSKYEHISSTLVHQMEQIQEGSASEHFEPES